LVAPYKAIATFITGELRRGKKTRSAKRWEWPFIFYR
jgi:hypothetical protein